MPLDPLASRLERLLAHGSLVASELTPPMRRRLAQLFEFGVMTEHKAGGGKRVLVQDPAALESWIATHYPSGLRGTSDPLPARAQATANFRDSKAGGPLAAVPVFLRGFGDAVLRRGDQSFPLAALTASYGLAGVSLDPGARWSFEGTLALVENLELFLHVEQILPSIDAAVWTSGRFDKRALAWIASLPACRVLHVGDYDPVGLDEYLRVRAALPSGRASLHVPPDFERRLALYGRPELLRGSLPVLARVRRSAPPELQAVITAMDRQGKALEQEALLIPLPPVDPSPDPVLPD